LSGVDDQIENLKKEIQRSKSDLDLILKERETQAVLVKSIGPSLNNEFYIDLRADFSKSNSSLLGGQSHILEAEIFFDSQVWFDKTILITRMEDEDTTLRKHIGLKNSLIPKNLEKIRTFNADVVLYNNGTFKSDIRVDQKNF